MALVCFGLSHVELPVVDLERAKRFYSGVLGFPVKEEEEGACELDVNSALIRLLETKHVEHRASLHLSVADVEGSWRELVAAGATPLYEPARTSSMHLAGSVADPDGHTITVWRKLSEDEYGFMPELPKSQRWVPEAEALLKSLLLRVPALFRGLARRKVVREAEELAEGRVVDQELVVRAYIRSNARFTRSRVRQPLLDHGFDPNRYQEDFES